MAYLTPAEGAREQLYRRLHNHEVRRRVEFLGKHRMLSCTEALLRLQAGGLSPLEALREVRTQQNLFYIQFVDVAYFPVFQWAHVQLRKSIGDVLRILAHTPKWHIALWFADENVLLQGWRPIDLLDTNPEAVTSAAMEEPAVVHRSH
jgi:hypothetical protein